MSRRRVACIRRRTFDEEALGPEVCLCDAAFEPFFEDNRLVTVHYWYRARPLFLRSSEPCHALYVALDVLEESILEPQAARERTAQEPTRRAV